MPVLFSKHFISNIFIPLVHDLDNFNIDSILIVFFVFTVQTAVGVAAVAIPNDQANPNSVISFINNMNQLIYGDLLGFSLNQLILVNVTLITIYLILLFMFYLYWKFQQKIIIQAISKVLLWIDSLYLIILFVGTKSILNLIDAENYIFLPLPVVIIGCQFLLIYISNTHILSNSYKYSSFYLVISSAYFQGHIRRLCWLLQWCVAFWWFSLSLWDPLSKLTFE